MLWVLWGCSVDLVSPYDPFKLTVFSRMDRASNSPQSRTYLNGFVWLKLYSERALLNDLRPIAQLLGGAGELVSN